MHDMSNEAIHNIDRRTRSAEILETAEKILGRHEVASERLSQIAINPVDLVREDDPNDIYSMTRVQQDLAYVEDRNKDFAQSGREKLPNGLSLADVKKLAEIAEYDLIRGINIGGWIPEGRALKTSEFDDIRNGVDMIIEIGEKASSIGHLGLGVDVSFSLNLQKKFQRIKHEIDSYDGDRERLGVVKYFQSNKAGMRGELSGLPRVVAAFDLGVMEDLSVKSDRLEGHIGQAIMISSMEKQLSTFHSYAEDVNPACAEELQRSLAMVRAIDQMTRSTQRLEESGYVKNCKADEAIEAGLDLFV